MKKHMMEAIKGYFSSNGIKYNSNANLTELLADYLENTSKLITCKKRKVYESQYLQNKLQGEFADYRDVVTKFCNKFENGEDISGHLSRKIYDSTFYDKLLSSWGIYHVHLNEKEAHTNTEMKDNRAEVLLFIRVEGDNVYFIDVQKHSQKYVFSNFNLLEVLVDEWEYLMEPLEIKGIVPGSLQPKITCDKEINMLRKINVNPAFEIKGKAYMPGLGVTCAGSSVSSMIRAQRIVKSITNIKHVQLFQLTPNRDTLGVYKLIGDKKLYYI